MSAKTKQYIYWDSCVFLALIKAEPTRIDTLDNLWAEIINNPNMQVATSSTSVIEVAYGSRKTENAILSVDQIEKIDSIWRDPTVLTVDLTKEIALFARDITREALSKNWKLANYDAAHLATAMWLDKYTSSVSDVHTYDDRLYKFREIIGINICAPYLSQPRLPLPSS